MTIQSVFHLEHHSDHWSTTSGNHHHVDRALHPVTVELVKWAMQTSPPDGSSKVLDDACGTGIVTAEVKKSYPDVPVLAIDSSAGMLKVFEGKMEELGFKNVETRLLNGGNLTDVPSDSITHAFAGTLIDITHNDTACIQELFRILVPGGILAMNTWVDPFHPSIGSPWTKACQKVHPDYKPPMVTNPKWTTPDGIKENLVHAGFKDVQTKEMITHWKWSSPEDMTTWFFDGGNPVVKTWHDSLTIEHGGNLEDFRKPFQEEVVKEYKEEGGHLLRDEVANLTISRK